MRHYTTAVRAKDIFTLRNESDVSKLKRRLLKHLVVWGKPRSDWTAAEVDVVTSFEAWVLSSKKYWITSDLTSGGALLFIRVVN